VGIASNRLSTQYGESVSIHVQTARQAPRVGNNGTYRDLPTMEK